jgi:APA family basic amino acid/polyamine antiporter
VSAALSYGELAAMMPRAGGQYVYLREAYSPLWGFLYGWTLFLVIQTGTIAAVAVAFARYFGVLAPAISPTVWLVPPINLSDNYALSLSTQQLAAILIIVLLTFINSRGLQIGKLIQNIFTSAKTLSLVALILIGLVFARNADVVKANFTDLWTPRGVTPIKPDVSFISAVSAAGGAFGLFIAFCVAQVGSLFSSDAWNNITFTAGEVKQPRRNIPLSLAAGTGLVTILYLLANVAYLCLLPLDKIQNAPDDRVATAAIETVFSGAGPMIMAVAIMISTFGCNNGLILAGARVYYAMARDGLFFKATAKLNDRSVPAVGLALQCLWTCLLVLPRTRLHDAAGAPKLDPLTGYEQYGNLYSNLLDYVVFAVLIFYVLTIFGLFILRRKRPDAERPYRAFGYPVVPALYILVASAIMLVLLLYKTQTTWPGLLIVLAGVPVYFLWNRRAKPLAPG